MIIGIDASRANHKQKTGVEWYAWFIIQELKKIIPDTVTVVLYSDVPLVGALAELPQNWTQRILKWPPKRFWTQIRLSLEMIRPSTPLRVAQGKPFDSAQGKPDVLFIPAHVPPLIHPKKTVMTVHDVAALHFPETYNWFERWYSVASAKYAVKNLPTVIVPSLVVKSDLLTLCEQKESRLVGTNIKIIPLGFNPQFSKLLSETQLKKIKEKYQLPEKYILAIGRLEEKKNTARLIAAFAKAVTSGLDTELVLVGNPGHGYEKIARALKISPFKNKIKIIPWAEENDLIGILQAAHIFVFPSLYEGFGLPVLQAFASRVPVIISNVGSLPEVAGDAVLYVDPIIVDELARTMLQLTNDSGLRAELIQRGTQRALQFSWEKCARETWEVLNSLCL
ncbi:MAG: hypothetical protein A2821_02645 [Candidatus Magasanikbacteria bacterium RIFCSPHIGHO2_01_FULL_41_23]|uniref:Glycosyl transferase family 1 domain-containing protein n=1 Tax=Candidatus Magasanikbacteria bacterium RIFCSPLOWO2_01_FULL_40_15 TaxID=1798686 RepID=A0A1F6N2R1_9BACT|nr:MAG: hypothetical protein A2821_02645 [Candidatus Magasanikbacteria bacterium RIFCSPHIGHO2_01_FULL_41_23]OGH66905.1 MAG: hypothetical protein A3C66_02425 [Candidatus Magasanikbacteria bacterium RIFCSPHIGHO2_02_FULL_41_35]OGH74889.1 MAG: hypothetical protein A3F22_04355 [Candidatus Magasanikbacteria bacterium RIFCSPHIGHO2_12_FULL_41_16]OGH78162.1 MAG: hypothetical protein A2983_03770 [Candidatus Magasanikbacteria bacterium RIFCSPLOWO2_01_FULL_40_15]